MTAEQLRQLQDAAGAAWSAYAARHPSLAEKLTQLQADPVRLITDGLADSPALADLIERTEKSLDWSAFWKAVIPELLRVGLQLAGSAGLAV